MAHEETLSLPDLECPMPVLRAKKRLAALAPGDLLHVASTDKHSLADLAQFCRQTGHGLEAQKTEERDGRAWFITTIRRKD